jgi:hypothetical protein
MKIHRSGKKHCRSIRNKPQAASANSRQKAKLRNYKNLIRKALTIVFFKFCDAPQFQHGHGFFSNNRHARAGTQNIKNFRLHITRTA